MSLTHGMPRSRHQSENEALYKLASALNMEISELVSPERRLVIQDIMLSPNNEGKDQEHLVVLFSDEVLICEQTKEAQNELHQFDIKHQLNIKGIRCEMHPAMILMENDGLSVVVEASNRTIYNFYSLLRMEMTRANPPRELPRSVVRPSKDPRVRTMRMDRIDDEQLGIVRPQPRQPQVSVDLSNMDSLRALKGKGRLPFGVLHEDPDNPLVEVEDDEGEVKEIEPIEEDDIENMTFDDQSMEDAVALQTSRVVEDNDPLMDSDEEDDENREGERISINVRIGFKLCRIIFGEYHGRMITKTRVMQYAGKIIMNDENCQKEAYRYVVFVDVFVVQKIHETKRYELFVLSECEATVKKGSITLRWPHKFFVIDIEPSHAVRWCARFKEAISVAKGTLAGMEKSKDDPIVIANCVVKRGGTPCVGRHQPESCPVGISLEEQHQVSILLQIQTSLGVTCDWFLNRRRRMIQQGNLMAYNSRGVLESRRLIVLTDRLIITKETEFKTNSHHTHDIVDDLSLVHATINMNDTLVHIRTIHPRARRFLIADSKARAKHWCHLLAMQAHKITQFCRRTPPELMVEDDDDLSSTRTFRDMKELESRKSQGIVIGRHREHSKRRMYQQIQEIVEIDGDEVTNASQSGSTNGVVEDDMVMHANSPVETRMADFDDEGIEEVDEESESDEDEDDEEEEEEEGEIIIEDRDEEDVDIRKKEESVKRLLYMKMIGGEMNGNGPVDCRLPQKRHSTFNQFMDDLPGAKRRAVLNEIRRAKIMENQKQQDDEDGEETSLIVEMDIDDEKEDEHVEVTDD